VLASLQPEREHQEEALQAGAERQQHAEAGGERRNAEQPGSQQRRQAACDRRAGPGAAVRLAGCQRDHGRHPSSHQRPGPGRPAELPALQQWVHDRHQASRQHRTGGQVRPARRRVSGFLNQQAARR
jgi:hypothetical protein